MIDTFFFELPALVYKDFPYKIPEDVNTIKNQLSGIPEDQIKLIVNDHCRVVGYIPDKMIEGDKVVFFGFWETLNNIESNKKAFKEIEHWAIENDAKNIYGPINLSTFNNYRIRLDNFDYPQFQGEPINPSYYVEFLEEMGYTIKHHYYTRYHTNIKELSQSLIPKIESQTHLYEQYDFNVLTKDLWMDRLDDLYIIVDQIFKDNFAYTPLSPDNFNRACGSPIANNMCSKSSVIAYEKGTSNIAGFFLLYPDYGPLMKQSCLNRLTTTEINYSYFDKLPYPKMALAKTAGVHPNHRSSGLFSLLGMKLIVQAAEHYDHLCGAMMRDDNHSLRFGMICPHVRSYGLFKKELAI